MSILNCQLKWSFALLVLRREKSVCKLLTPEHLEVYSIIVSADKDLKQLCSGVVFVIASNIASSNNSHAPKNLHSCGYQRKANFNHSSDIPTLDTYCQWHTSNTSVFSEVTTRCAIVFPSVSILSRIAFRSLSNQPCECQHYNYI